MRDERQFPTLPAPIMMHIAMCSQQAIQCAAAGDWAEAGLILHSVALRFGSAGTAIALTCVADTVASWQGFTSHRPDTASVSLTFRCARGHVIPTDEVPPPLRWAGRFVAAYAASDTGMVLDLLHADSPDDVHERSFGLLVMAVTTAQVLQGWPSVPPRG